MYSINLDIPIFISIFCILIYVKIYGTKRDFVIACEFASFFWAQISFLVSISLAKVAPIAAVADYRKLYKKGLELYAPFIFYCIFVSLFQSLFWKIPDGVNFFYGQGRVFVQLFNVTISFLVTMAAASVLRDSEYIFKFWRMLQILAVVHGAASIYQLIASAYGFPLIGISRAFDLTNSKYGGDVAAFVSDTGSKILRPGGLMGEPKSVSVLFGVVFLTSIFSSLYKFANRKDVFWHYSAILFSAVGFVLAFSTSSFVAILVAFFVLLFSFLKLKKSLNFFIVILLSFSLICFTWYVYTGSGVDGLYDAIFSRSVGRVSSGDMDPPVAASLQAIDSSFLVALFGTGLGGSSFKIMEFIGGRFDFSYSANIGFVNLWVELGLVGLMLFIFPYSFYFFKLLIKFKMLDYQAKLMIMVSIGFMIFCMTGSGVPLGFPLSIACMASAYNRIFTADSVAKSFALEPKLSGM